MSAPLPQVIAPFTPDQVASLNGFQKCGAFHPFTCGRAVCTGVGPLLAEEAGWRCTNCGYAQNWAHEFMADGSWRESAAEIQRFFGDPR